jgi:enoyl-CoA hydratase/carnithine racemase
VRIAVSEAKLAAPFSRRGMGAEFRLPWLLPAVVGRANALELLVSGRTVLAEEGLAIGLVHRVVPPEELLSSALAYASEVADNCSPQAIALIKDQLRTARPGDPESIERLEDFAEGMAALLERRSPNFPGLDGGSIRWKAL